ncbi:MAG TPA: NosD domain-containing protein [Candidatus Thermoplasmatota archaeon]|nr:NosD domain-containing protein [Candidatus Thermoplasmatota archaeon]
METTSVLRKRLAVGIMLFSIGSAIIPSTAQDTATSSLTASRGHWLYVGGSGPGNYTTIQDAVNASSDGDTVFVYDDSSPYHETVVVNTSITLLGESRDTTVIDDEATNYSLTVSIYANHVQVRGLCFLNTGWESYAIWVFAVSDIVIADNAFPGNFNGIYIDKSDPILVEDNTFVGDKAALEITSDCSQASVLRNHFEQGIEALIMGAKNSTVRENIFRGNSGTGIRLSAQNVSVLWNTFDANIGFGIEITAATVDARIQYNTINGSAYGIMVEAVDSSSLRISYNTLTNNSRGIGTWLCSRVNISCNNFIHNSQHAYFDKSWWFQRNHWDGNYWDDYHGKGPEVIHGSALFLVIPLGYFHTFCLYLPWVNFDWHPAHEPSDISAMDG